MGTSAPGGGAGGNNPLIPNWIDGGGLPPQAPLPPNPDDNNDNGDEGNDNESDSSSDNEQDVNIPAAQNNMVDTNRYRQPRIQFNKFIRSGGSNQQALKSALKGYSRHAAGGTTQMARRMKPAVSRVTGFYEVINTV